MCDQRKSSMQMNPASDLTRSLKKQKQTKTLDKSWFIFAELLPIWERKNIYI